MTGKETRNQPTRYWPPTKSSPAKSSPSSPTSSSGVDRHLGQGAQGTEEPQVPESPRSHERSRTHLHRPSRTLHPPDRRDRIRQGMPANQKAARTGGNIAKRARIELESRTAAKSSPARTTCPHQPHQAPSSRMARAVLPQIEKSLGTPSIAFWR